MPGWVNDILQPERLFTITLIVFLGYVTVKSIGKNWKFLSKFVSLVNTLVGDADTPGIGVRMDVMTKELKENTGKLDAMEKRVSTIHHEVTPNHGGSMNDALRRSEEQGKKTAGKVAETVEKLDQHIQISKTKDAEQEDTARKLDQHISDTEKWSPLIQDLHDQYYGKKRQQPPEPPTE